jgi:SnoaL-like protein
MTNSCEVPVRTPPTERLLDALTTRDFDALAACLEPSATMRALLPRGFAEYENADQIVGAFEFWFGGANRFEVVASSVDDVAGTIHASWRFRVDKTPRGTEGWHTIEQQVFVRGSRRVESIDLMCTGFIAEEATQ